MAFLEIHQLTKAFGSVAAVRGISLSIGRGEFVALLGPSGCGKSSLLRLVAGLERPDSGSIVLDGKDITSLVPQKRGIGLVFQNYALFPHMTVEQNVAFGLEGKGLANEEIGRRVTAMLEAVHLSGKQTAPVTALSGGEQQRVAVARALVVQPAVLLLDEPLSNLDVGLRQQTREEIRALQRQTGITTIHVTHDQAEALSMADRVAVMRSGSLEQIGSPVDLYDRPASSFVAMFLGGANLLNPEGDILIPDQVRKRVKGGDVIAVKPEIIRVSVATAHAAASGTLLEREYLGFLTTLVVQVGSTVLRASIPSAEVSRALRPGETVGVDIDWSRAVVCEGSSR
jgi:ABC-type Fe3+/spermidine/putrescine transport system ATPase subunit